MVHWKTKIGKIFSVELSLVSFTKHSAPKQSQNNDNETKTSNVNRIANQSDVSILSNKQHKRDIFHRFSLLFCNLLF